MKLTRTTALLLEALRSGQRVQSEALIGLLWPDRRTLPMDPHGTIRVHMHNLRRQLPAYLMLTGQFREGYQLSLSSEARSQTGAGRSSASALSSTLPNSPAVRPVGGFLPSEDLLKRPSARTAVSENARQSMRPMTAPMSSISAPAFPTYGGFDVQI
jgi:hypothetical protein